MRNAHVARFILLLLALSFFTAHAEWVQMDEPEGGNIDFFAVSGDTVITTIHSGGSYFSTNNGFSWSVADFNYIEQHLSPIFLHGNTLFANSPDNNLYRSTDFGTQWTKVSGAVLEMAGDNHTLFARTKSALFLSQDNGTTWTEILTGLEPPDGHGNLLAYNGETIVTSHFSCLYLSTDNGMTWREVEYPTRYQSNEIVSLAMSRNTLFVATFKQGFFRSEDIGTSWSNISDQISPTLNSTLILMLTANDSAVFAGTQHGVFRSVNTGTAWTPFDSALTAKAVTTLVANGANVFAGTSVEGVFRSVDNGTSWAKSNSGIKGASFGALAVIDNKLFAGVNGRGIFCSDDKGASLSPCYHDPTHIAVDKFLVHEHTLFTITSTNTGDVILRSIDKGNNWSSINPLPLEDWGYSIARNATTLFVNSNKDGLFRSEDDGTTWTTIDSINLPGCTYVPNVIPSTDNAIWYTCREGVFRSTDNGDSWKQIDSALKPNFIAADGEALIAFCNQGVHRSTDKGEHFYAVEFGLPKDDLFIRSFTEGAGYFFIGTSKSGIYFSADQGKSWTAISSGLPNTHITSLAVSGDNLFAGAGGYGLWRLALSEVDEAANMRFPQKYIQDQYCTVLRPGLSSTITFELTVPQTEKVAIRIFTLSGREITTIINKRLSSNTYRFQWHTNTVSSGCYLAKIQLGKSNFLKRIPIF